MYDRTALTAEARRVLRPVRRAGRKLEWLPGRARLAITSRATRTGLRSVQVLTPAQALRTNGFTVFRGLVPATECATLAARYKAAAGITEGERFTRTDTTNKIPATRETLFDERVLDAVRTALDGDIRFLQVGDLHYLSDTAGWHRDSVHRAEDNTAAPDWRDDQGRYGIVKAILYLQSDNAAMGLIGGSHLSPFAVDIDAVKKAERWANQLVIDVQDEPNRRFSDRELTHPLAWRALPGDLLVFDQRTYHAGRRVDGGTVTKNREAAKFTLSLTFGLDNMHSTRFHSYFRYARRELGYRPFAPEFREQLAEHDLVLSSGFENYYLQHPDELRLVSLRRPETMEPLIEEFRRAGSSVSDRAGVESGVGVEGEVGQVEHEPVADVAGAEPGQGRVHLRRGQHLDVGPHVVPEAHAGQSRAVHKRRRAALGVTVRRAFCCDG